MAGWFPILTSWSEKVNYIDCHAGRGRHADGHEGSPILALNILLGHHARDRILASSQVNFLFLENNKTNHDALANELESLGKLPAGIDVAIKEANYEAELTALLSDIRRRDQRIAPSFAFVDPYGFVIPMELLNAFLEFEGCELMINFMYRYVIMAMQHENQSHNLDRIFGQQDWRQIADITDPRQREDAVISMYAGQLQARFVTHMYMKSDRGALKYVLFHATNNRKGRELMKDAIWSLTPDGSFTAHEHHAPNQAVLIQPNPDLRPLKTKLLGDFAGQTVPMSVLYSWLLESLFLQKHLHEVLREWRKSGVVTMSGYSGSFAFNKKPIVTFPATA